MAATFLSPVIKKLADLLFEEAAALKGVHKHVKCLKEELEIIEPFLRDAEAKSGRRELNDATKVWLNQLRDIADRIEDVVDEYTYRLQHQRSQTGFLGSLRKGGHWLKSLKPRHEIASEIRDIEESLQKVKERGVSFGLRPFEQGSSSTTNIVVDPRIGSILVDDDDLVGIESLSKELFGRLVEGGALRTVVSLVGVGGIGKTTLAWKVFNDVEKKGCFDHHVWVTVSQSYDIDKILKILMNRICPTSREYVTIEEGFALLKNSLQGKRYVIAFDDVWQTDFWSVISHALPSNSNGSRILVTTRISMVVESFNQIYGDVIVQELKTWSTEQAWELFCKKAFHCSKIEPELEPLSREILSKCRGIPIAIVSVAGLLSKRVKTKVEWQRVLDSLEYGFDDNPEFSDVSNVLLLSYHDLPHHLKLCLLYFGMYAEDSSISGKWLSRYWIAEGFIQSREDMTLEQIADEYLIELTNRNLVSFVLKLGGDRYFQVHDLIYETILRKSKEMNFSQQFNKGNSSFNEKNRRLFILSAPENIVKEVVNSKIRSIIIRKTDHLTSSFVVGILKNCELLKVLVIENSPLDYLPEEVGNLLHLKFLGLEGVTVKRLPKSIGKLLNLQTLLLRNTLVRELPIEINKLKNLRHIAALAADKESELNMQSPIGVRIHEGIGRLDELQSLSFIEANPAKVGFVKELQNLRKLKDLGITKVTAEMGKALAQSIEKMNLLEYLFISSNSKEEVLDMKFISHPPPLLRYLRLDCRLQQLPSWISELHHLQSLSLNFSRLIDNPVKYINGLPNLEFLRLDQAYEGGELHFEENGFPKLKQLELRKLEGLKEVKMDKEALPLVEELVIGPWPLVKEMPCDIQYLTSLKTLTILDMPREFVKALQHEGGSGYRKIQHIPSVTFCYYSGIGVNYNGYKLGSPELLQYLQRQQ